MKARSAIAGSVVALCLAACSPQDDAPEGDGTWVGTITTEGNVTTVVNKAGSVWDGTATLVEEASIGVEVGPDEYMFGYVDSVWATDDRVYVVDRQVPAVRVYDTTGRHIRDIGRPGQGPGEYELPTAVFTTPDGRVLVQEFNQRVGVYSEDGEYLDTWHGDRDRGTDLAGTLTHGGRLYTRTWSRGVRSPSFRMAEVGPDGIGDKTIEFPTFDVPVRPTLRPSAEAGFFVPLWPGIRRVMMPSATVVAGVNTTYRFVMARPDGSRVLVETEAEPLVVSAEEREWRRRNLVSSARRFNPDWNWDGAEIPVHHPAFTALLPDRSNRIWVLRPESVERVAVCTEDPLSDPYGSVVPCWRTVDRVDVFEEATGKLLGDVEIPPNISWDQGFINGATVYAPIEDEDGTIMVKRYRLVLPGEE